MIFRKAVLTIYYLCLVFLILIAVLFIGSKVPIAGNYSLMTVMSGSMEPAIKTGSVAVIKPFENYRIGDIVTFKGQESAHLPVSHRIIEAEVAAGQTLFTTKGDANPAPDAQKIKEEDILGKVLFSLPFFGYAVDFIRRPIGFLVVICLPAVIILAGEVRKIWQEVKIKKD